MQILFGKITQQLLLRTVKPKLLWNRAFSISKEEYDYVIVGAGSAGCVLANRLSAAPHNRKVLLLEAGPKDNNWTIQMPAAFVPNIGRNTYNWNYNTIPQKHVNNRVMFWPRGRVLGGSSSINAMIYIRGHPTDFNRWAEIDNATGWSYADCLPYFKKAQCHEYGPDLYRGADGPLKISRAQVKHPLHYAWIKAGQEAGYPLTNDFNGFQQEGVGWYDHTIHNGVRWSTANAYLKPALQRTNLKVITGALSTKIVFQGKTAIGVQYLLNDKQETAFAAKEVILSGGTINSPQLLMLSGIGNADSLKKVGVEPFHHLPGVGLNLQDHLQIGIQHTCKLPITLQMPKWKFLSLQLRWFLTKGGWGATCHAETGGFVRSEAAVPHPDIQFHLIPSIVIDHGRVQFREHGYQVIINTEREQSRGQITLLSNNPKQHPLIDPNYLSTERDIWELRQGVKLGREILNQAAFDKYSKSEISPGKDVQSDKEIDAFIRQKVETIYHPCGSCKMGSSSDKHSVVDTECRVIGLDKLRVVDASIMPSIISGNLNATVIMIAEKISDLVMGNKPLPKMNDVAIWTPKHKNLQREK